MREAYQGSTSGATASAGADEFIPFPLRLAVQPDDDARDRIERSKIEMNGNQIQKHVSMLVYSRKPAVDSRLQAGPERGSKRPCSEAHGAGQLRSIAESNLLVRQVEKLVEHSPPPADKKYIVKSSGMELHAAFDSSGGELREVATILLILMCAPRVPERDSCVSDLHTSVSPQRMFQKQTICLPALTVCSSRLAPNLMLAVTSFTIQNHSQGAVN